MNPYYTDDQITLYHGDALDVASQLPTGSADCIVTSPPYYGLRDYGTAGQYGLEASPAEYVERLRVLFGELRRVLADDGTLWLNLGDSYSGNASPGGETSRTCTSPPNANRPITITKPGKSKNLLGIPWRVAFALQDDSWILRNAIIWNKPNAMPESVTDRLSGKYEHVFLFVKQKRYWFDLDPIREPRLGQQGGTKSAIRPGMPLRQYNGITAAGNLREVNDTARNPGDVWTIPTQPFPCAHFACYPIQLPQRAIQAGCKPGGTVCDPFHGSGTTGAAAQRTGRKYIGIDINAKYLDLSLNTRLRNATLDFTAPTEGTA
jgi:site-specific DNA-methyltransferase (cytosine-N4-specific)